MKWFKACIKSVSAENSFRTLFYLRAALLPPQKSFSKFCTIFSIHFIITEISDSNTQHKNLLDRENIPKFISFCEKL